MAWCSQALVTLAALSNFILLFTCINVCISWLVTHPSLKANCAGCYKNSLKSWNDCKKDYSRRQVRKETQLVLYLQAGDNKAMETVNVTYIYFL